MDLFMKLAFLFLIGSLIGWGIEVVFRRFFSAANPERKWINPGFLSGPYLPLYGFSLCVLYLLASCEPLLPVPNPVWRKAALFAVMALCVTGVEYLAGLIFIKGLHVKLWDYSTQWGNVNGIICPKFTLFWLALSAAYYFLVHPHILDSLAWLANNLAFSFFIGFFYGVFAIDFVASARLVARIKRFAEENGIVVRLEELRAHIRKSREERSEKARFLLSLYSSVPLGRHLKEYADRCRAELDAAVRAKKHGERQD